MGILSTLLGGIATAATGGLAAPLIAAGSQLIGGAMDRKATRSANAANTPSAQVAAWEKAGINPIVGITQGQYVPQVAHSLGDAFADAGSAISNGMNLYHDRALAETALEQENEALRESLADLTRRPSGVSAMQTTGIGIPSPVRTAGLASNPRFNNDGGAFTLAPQFRGATPEVVVSADENGHLDYTGTRRTYTDLDGNTIERTQNPVSILEEEDGEVPAMAESLIRTGPYLVNRMQDVGSGILWTMPYGGRDRMRQDYAEADRAAGYDMPQTRIERMNSVFEGLGQGISFGGLQLN